jgi:haloalkane dehalogenase
MISHQELPKQFAQVHGRRMAYTEMGQGDPIVFLHGNPTSSYLWRNILPGLADLGHCIAPDLIGMGDSDKLPNSGPDSYQFAEHRHYLDGLLEQLDVKSNVILVLHDWGSSLGFDWANRHRDAVRGIAYMEALVRPAGWDEWPEIIRPIFKGFRSEAGENMVLDKNLFVEKVLPGSVLRGLTEQEMEVYRRPFLNPGEDRRPHCQRLLGMAGRQFDSQAVYKCRTRSPADRRNTRILQELAESTGSDGQGKSFHPGRFTWGDYPGPA